MTMKIQTRHIGAILGVAPSMKRTDVTRRMAREHHGADPEGGDNVALQWGRANQPGALIEFTMETGIATLAPEYVETEVLSSSVIRAEGLSAIVVIRCPFSLRKESRPNFKTAEEQPHYYAGMQMDMYVSSADCCYFYQWAPNGSKLELVKRDDVFIDAALPAINIYIKELESDIDNSEHLEPLRQIIDTPDAVKLINEYDELTDALDQAKQRQSEIMDALVILANGKNSIVAGRNLTRIERQGSISYAKAVKELAPGADLEKFRGKGSESWRLF